MCGRFTLTVDRDDLIEQFALDLFPEEFSLRFNVSPTQPILSAVQSKEGRRAGYMKWGLVPYWVKDIKKWKPLINARSETIDEKASFKHLLQKRRCIVFADSFYEWKKTEAGEKIPYRIYLKNKKPFAFAGLWDRHNQGQVQTVTCTVLTTEANDVVKEVHDRMPVIFTDEHAIHQWLNVHEYTYKEVEELLKPLDSSFMDKYIVSSVVNSSKTDDQRCIEPMI